MRREVSFRLVFDQDPDTRSATPSAACQARVPADCSVEFHEHGGGTAVAFDTGPGVSEGARALTDEWGKEAAFIGGGGSIPVTTLIKQTFDIPVVMVGFGLATTASTSPNEKYELTSFRRGIRSWARILAALAE